VVSPILRDLDEALATIGDRAVAVVPTDYGGVAMEATRALVRRGIKRLHLVTLPASSLQADLLIGAGAVATIETAAVTMGELGPAPRFTAAVLAGSLAVKDATCPALHAALQAAEKGVPFMPLRGLIGSDLVKHRPDWRVIDNPFGPLDENGGGDPIVLLPAIRPDVALFHTPMADRNGNVWIGRRREVMTMAHAAVRSIVTVERLYDGDLMASEETAAGTIPALYIEAIAVAPRGAWPLPLAGEYPRDDAHLAEYVALAATEDGFRRYLDRYVYARKAA
jgi:glutaconate CoA-transferase subunit A